MDDVRDLRKIIGQRLRDLRVSRGWTQGDVESRAKVSKDFIGRCERGLREPSLYMLTKLARVFEVPSVFLMTASDEKKRPLLREIEALLVERPDDEVRWIRDVVRQLLNHPGGRSPQLLPARRGSRSRRRAKE